MPSISLLFLIAVLKFNVLGVVSSHLHFKPNYTDALSKSILFFEGQRSGKLPSSQRMKWRKTSALHEGHDVGVDLTGGYYDAGDNVKFNFPMAFSTAVLAWGVIEFGNSMGSELEHAMQAIKWGTDYFLKSTSIHNKVFVQIGEPFGDHNCWERPEDMDTNRTTYAVDKDHPGSEVSAEIAAALASSSIAFKKSHPSYSRKLLRRALKVFKFADKYQGNYNDSLGLEVCPFYCDWSGYEDELAWAAAWLYKATHKRRYLDYVTKNVRISLAKKEPNPVRKTAEFGWDNKRSGIYVLMAKELMSSSFASDTFVFQENADGFVCGVLPESQTRVVNYSRGGLIYKGMGSNMQNPTAISLLLLVYSRYLKHTNHIVHCGHKRATPDRLIALAKSQVDYILGKNPLKMSYMVGYGNKFPQKIHHRGSSLPSIDQHPQKLGCKDGTPYFESILPNPNVLVGAVVGGPALNDTYADSRSMFVQSEPTTYINAPLVGPLAFFSSPKRRNLD